jgi:hypothetical protein
MKGRALREQNTEIVDHPHIWVTDELMQKHPHDVFAPEAISS